MKQPKTGDCLWYRDLWGTPIRMIVDYYEIATQFVTGINTRGGFVRLPVAKFSRTLAECESCFARSYT